ncbi:hypothetical protein FB45DRAFT_907601 [Roridomyces roridus]|uniref:Mid2 domain-containing protein n=1 Tax=Roridomyces roridus TaxID=1738132 RepID=A0AAD7C3Q7_9AGAR|nr:hypothetical protein FB45DRAFT_907601 [Roridomyces roridus]
MLPAALLIWAFSQFGWVHAALVSRDDPSTGVSNAFNFNPISMTSCNPANISWVYSPALGQDSTELSLTITNSGVPQLTQSATATASFSIHPFSRRDDPITTTITPVDFINPALREFTWSNVSVPAGMYIIQAFFPIQNTIFPSPSFFVANGCNDATASSAGPSSSSATSTTASSAPSPSSSSGSTLPVAAASSKKVNRGAIAGGIIGGLAIVAAAIAAYFYLRFASSGAPSPRKRTRKWGGLGSFDSKTYPSAPRGSGTASNRHHSQSDSVGPMLDNNVYVIGNVGIDSRPSRINDNVEYEAESYFSPSQEKISSTPGSPMRSPFSDSGHVDDDVPMDLISSSPLGGTNITRNSSTSTSSYMNNNFSRPRSHPGSPYLGSPPSESPFSNSARNTTTSTLGHSDPSSYVPSPSPAYPSGTSQSMSPSPVLPAAVQRSSTGEMVATGSRRTPRKPVPQYNPTDPALSSPPLPAQPLPVAAVDSEGSSSSREGSVHRAGGTQDWPSLTHKASFGSEGRPVHYLIPDMPLPQPRD